MANNFLELAEKRRPDFETALGAMQPDDKRRFMALAIRGVQNHKHKDGSACSCTAESMVQCVIDACLTGLEVGTANDHAYLIPYKPELTFRPGYKGLIYRAIEAGICDHMYAEIVRANDKVEVDGTKRTIKHDFNPFLSDKDRGPMVGVYAVAILSNGLRDFEALNVDDIAAVQRKAAPGSMMWKEFPGEAWKKSAIRRLTKRLQGGREITGEAGRKLAAALEADNKEYDVETTGTRIEAGGTTLDKVADELPAHEPVDPVLTEEQQQMLMGEMVRLKFKIPEIPTQLERLAGCKVAEIRLSQMSGLLEKVSQAAVEHTTQ